MAVDVPDSFVARNKTPPRYPPPKPPSSGTVANQVPSATPHNHQKPHDKSDHRSQKHAHQKVGQQTHIKSNNRNSSYDDQHVGHKTSNGTPSSVVVENHKVGRFDLVENGHQPNHDHQKSQQNTGKSISDDLNESDLSDDKKTISISDNERSISLSSTNESTDRYDSIVSYDIDTIERNNRKNDAYDNPSYFIDHRYEKTIVTISDDNRGKENLIIINSADDVRYVNKTRLTINTDDYTLQYPIVTVNHSIDDREVDLSPDSGKLSTTDTEDYNENYDLLHDNIVPSDNDFRLSYNNIRKSSEGVVLTISSVVNDTSNKINKLVIDDFEVSDDNVASFNSYEPFDDQLSSGGYELLNSRYKFAGCDIASSLYDHCKYMDDENELLVDSFDGSSYNVDSFNYSEVNASVETDVKDLDDNYNEDDKIPIKHEHVEVNVIENEKPKNDERVINTYKSTYIKTSNKLTISGYDNKAYISDMFFVESNSGHREMAVDVPADFVQRKKTPPKYPVLKKEKEKAKNNIKFKKSAKKGKYFEKENILKSNPSSKSLDTLNDTIDDKSSDLKPYTSDYSYGAKISDTNILSITSRKLSLKKSKTDEMKSLLGSKADEESIELDVLNLKPKDLDIGKNDEDGVKSLWISKSGNVKYSKADNDSEYISEISKCDIDFSNNASNDMSSVKVDTNLLHNKQKVSGEENTKDSLQVPAMAFRCKDPKWRTQHQVYFE